jgi:hypothetical protein
LHFEHQKVGKNTCETPIQMLSASLGASIFTFVKTCVERYGSYLMVDQSIVAAVDIDLGVVSFVEESAHIFDFAVVPWDFRELRSVPHCFSCICIMFNSYLVVIFGLGQRFHVMRSCRALLVHSRRMQIHPYLVSVVDGPRTMIMFNPVLNGGESIF